MDFPIELPQPIKDWVDAIPQNAEWFALGTCLVVLITLGILLLIGRLIGARILYFFFLAGVIIFASDLFYRHIELGRSWADIYHEYSPHFSSEILITFVAVAILDRSIAIRERRHEIRDSALGGLRFFVRFCEQHNCSFTEQHLHWLRDEQNAFNSRKANRMAQMSRTERTHYEAAAEKVDALVQAVSDYYTPPDPNVPADVRQRSIVSAADALRPRYQACRTVFWQSSGPDRIE
jgi:hypothetical protein